MPRLASAPTQALNGHWVISGWRHRSCAFSPLGITEQQDWQLAPSGAFGSLRSVCDGEKCPKSVIDRFRIRESLAQHGIEEHHVGSAPVLGGIFTANAAREIVLRPHIGGLSLNWRFLHDFVFHASSLRER